MQQSPDESPLPRSTLQQWYSNTRLQKLTTSESLNWTNARLEIAQHEPVPEMAYSPYMDVDVFAFLIEGSAQMQMRTPDGGMRKERVRPGTLQLLPYHTVYGGSWDASWTYGALQLDREMLNATSAAILRGDPERIVLVPTFGFYDPFLYDLGTELANEMQNASPLGSIYSESLVSTLTMYLLKRYSTGRLLSEPVGTRFTRLQMHLLDEYIHAHLDQKISLADLANCLHLSVPHFERMFRASYDRPPYRYVLELRLNCARNLIETTRLTLAEVALQCGFSSQSHFTTHFTRFMGISPARFARRFRE